MTHKTGHHGVVAIGLICCVCCCARAQGGLIATTPVDYRVGPIPVQYQPFNYTAYPYTPGSIPDITDGSLATFTKLQGLDNVVQPSNGVRIDTGTFYLLKFLIDPSAEYFHIDFTASAEPYPLMPFGTFQVMALSADGVDADDVFWQTSASSPTTFGVDFFRDHNTGNQSHGIGRGLDQMLNPDGTLRMVLGGVTGAGINQTGRITTYLYDVSASYSLTVPEPGSLLGVISGAFLTTFARRRRSNGRH